MVRETNSVAHNAKNAFMLKKNRATVESKPTVCADDDQNLYHPNRVENTASTALETGAIMGTGPAFFHRFRTEALNDFKIGSTDTNTSHWPALLRVRRWDIRERPSNTIVWEHTTGITFMHPAT